MKLAGLAFLLSVAALVVSIVALVLHTHH